MATSDEVSVHVFLSDPFTVVALQRCPSFRKGETMAGRLLEICSFVRGLQADDYVLVYVVCFLSVAFTVGLFRWMQRPKLVKQQPKPKPKKVEQPKVRTRRDDVEDLIREHQETIGLVEMVPLDPDVKESVKERADQDMLEKVVNLMWRK